MDHEVFNRIDCSWHPFFKDNLTLISGILETLKNEKQVIPSNENIFRVFTMPVNKIKVVILGQDPYPDPKNAMGLAFSVPKGVTVPGSLYNIYTELNNCYPGTNHNVGHGDLTRWFTEEGIFLYNVALTTVAWKSASHMKLWNEFSNNVIKYLSDNPKIVFLLLGNKAIDKSCFVKHKHMIVKAVHPSPLSAHRGFIGSKVFLKVDELLDTPVNWLP
jgi:uracil-DNA glycosylase